MHQHPSIYCISNSSGNTTWPASLLNAPHGELCITYVPNTVRTWSANNVYLHNCIFERSGCQSPWTTNPLNHLLMRSRHTAHPI